LLVGGVILILVIVINLFDYMPMEHKTKGSLNLALLPLCTIKTMGCILTNLATGILFPALVVYLISRNQRHFN